MGRGSPLRASCRLLAHVRWPLREERLGPKPSRLRCLAGGSALSQGLPNSREDAYPGFSIELTQPGESEKLKKQSERLGEGAGATGLGSSTQIALSWALPASPGDQPGKGTRVAAPRCGRQARGTHKARTVWLPLKKPKRRKDLAPGPAAGAAVRAGAGDCPPRGRLRLFFRG